MNKWMIWGGKNPLFLETPINTFSKGLFFLTKPLTVPETNSSPMKIPTFPGFHTIKMVGFSSQRTVSLQEGTVLLFEDFRGPFFSNLWWRWPRFLCAGRRLLPLVGSHVSRAPKVFFKEEKYVHPRNPK